LDGQLLSVREELGAAGIGLAADDDRSMLRVECARLARLLRKQLWHTIGLAPAGDDVAVPAIAFELGRALAGTNAGPVGVVDARGSWACARSLVDGAVPDGTLLATSWLLDNLAVLTPRSFGGTAMLAQLQRAVVEKTSVFGHLVVDLTGFDHLGEQLAAFAFLDAVFPVARSGRTTARQIQRWLRDFPEGRALGVLLSGL
jgi:hypothetical protein